MSHHKKRRAKKKLVKGAQQEAPRKENESQLGRLHTETQTPAKPPRRYMRAAVWIWGGFLGTIAVVGFAYQFRPIFSVSNDAPLNPQNPFTAEFKVTNNGVLPVYHLVFSCTVNNTVLHNVTVTGFSGGEPVSVLEPNDSATKSCSIVADSFPWAGELIFSVQYRPMWYWGRLTRKFRFVNIKDNAGDLLWIQQPYGEKSN